MIKKLITGGLTKKQIISIFVIAAVDMLSMTAPYYLKYVIPEIYKYLNITQAEFDSLNAVLGYVVLATQLPSGWLADKLSGKKLLILSVILSGIFTIMFGMATQGIFGDSSLVMLYLIFAGFGISTTLFLWAPLWKVLSQQGNAEEQSKVFGLQGSYNGFLGLAIVTLIGTLATWMAGNGNNSLFYFLVYFLGALLLLTSFGIYFFIDETNEKSSLLLGIKSWFKKGTEKTTSIWESIKSLLKPLLIFRVWLIAFSVLGMYMFQSIFAYYLKDYMIIAVPAIIITIVASFRTYGLRLLVSAPFGLWLRKRKSWLFTMSFLLLIGIMVATIGIMIPGFGNNITSSTSKAYKTALAILLPIIVIAVGIFSWFLVAGRYLQINEIPHTKDNYGTILAIISLIAFSSDAWFYQMASSWMKSAGHIMDAADVANLGYGAEGGYDQAGLQMLLFVALGIGTFGALCGFGAFLISKHELKNMKLTDYRWRMKVEHEKNKYEKPE